MGYQKERADDIQKVVEALEVQGAGSTGDRIDCAWKIKMLNLCETILLTLEDINGTLPVKMD